jgi:hypothetical protein
MSHQAIGLALKESGELTSRILLHRGQDVGIDPEGDFDALMPKSLLNHMYRHPGLQEQRRASMPEPMELDGLDTSLSEKSLEFPLSNSVTLQRMPQVSP